ncbi:MAG: hypothetical protein R3195_06655 [Gemmatimonadota bacterium]|nr:hypothetical protein [Gemmatimonadota bacterium]
MSNSSDKIGSVVPSEVSDLISESRMIQGWLDRLAEHRDDADPQVFARVETDYRGRLDKVTAKLVQHRSELVSSLEERQSEVDSLRADRQKQAGHLEEARLRHAVGEFSDKQWAEASEEIESSLSDLDELLELEEGAVGELAGIIESIGEGGALPPAPEASAAADPEGTGAPAKPPEPKQTVGAGAEAAPSKAGAAPANDAGTEATIGDRAERDDAPAVRAGSVDGDGGAQAPEDDDITVEADDDGPTAVVTETRTTEEGDEDDSGGEYLDELEFLESLSLDESERFDAVSAMLDDDEEGEK